MPSSLWSVSSRSPTYCVISPSDPLLVHLRPGLPGVTDTNGEVGHLLVHLVAFLHQFGDLLVSVDDGGVVTTAELLGDRRIGEVGEVAEQVHRDLPGDDQAVAAGSGCGVRQL